MPLILLVGASGSGKSTIADIFVNEIGLEVVQSYTTRPPRTPDEKGHTFISQNEFQKLENLVAYTNFNGFEYCATQAQVDNADIYVIDPAGIEYFKENYNSDRPYIVVLIQANPDVCYSRMINRGDSPEYAKSRIDHDDYIYYNPNKPIDCDIKVNSLYAKPETLAACILGLVGCPLTLGSKSNYEERAVEKIITQIHGDTIELIR